MWAVSLKRSPMLTLNSNCLSKWVVTPLVGDQFDLSTGLKEYFLTADENDGIPIADDTSLYQTGLWCDYRCRCAVGWIDCGPEAGSERVLCC